jgi:hypothetical protein
VGETVKPLNLVCRTNVWYVHMSHVMWSDRDACPFLKVYWTIISWTLLNEHSLKGDSPAEHLCDATQPCVCRTWQPLNLYLTSSHNGRAMRPHPTEQFPSPNQLWSPRNQNMVLSPMTTLTMCNGTPRIHKANWIGIVTCMSDLQSRPIDANRSLD